MCHQAFLSLTLFYILLFHINPYIWEINVFIDEPEFKMTFKPPLLQNSARLFKKDLSILVVKRYAWVMSQSLLFMWGTSNTLTIQLKQGSWPQEEILLGFVGSHWAVNDSSHGQTGESDKQNAIKPTAQKKNKKRNIILIITPVYLVKNLDVLLQHLIDISYVCFFMPIIYLFSLEKAPYDKGHKTGIISLCLSD